MKFFHIDNKLKPESATYTDLQGQEDQENLNHMLEKEDKILNNPHNWAQIIKQGSVTL